MVIKPLLQLASPAGKRAQLSILIYHRVTVAPDTIFPGEMHANRFNEVCGWLKTWFNVLPLDAAVAHLKAGTLPARAACITFDDGYADNHDVALPILQKHGLPATFFIATGFLDGGRMWNDTVIEAVRRCEVLPSLSEVLPAFCHAGPRPGIHPPTTAERQAAIQTLINQIKYLPVAERITVTEELARKAKLQLPTNLMMTSAQVKALRQAGMQIGAHTVSHPILAKLSDEQAHAEIKGSKDTLEQLLGERVSLFAYPNGKPGEDYTPATVQIVKALGFDAAVSTDWGAARAGADTYQLPRFAPWDQTKMRFGLRMLSNLLQTR